MVGSQASVADWLVIAFLEMHEGAGCKDSRIQ